MAFRKGGAKTILEQPALAPEIREDGTVLFGNVEVQVEHQRFFRLLEETAAKLPKSYSVKSLEMIVFLQESHSETIAGLTVYTCPNRQEEKPRQRIELYLLLLSQLKDSAVKGVIAHELAHAWLNEHVGPEEGHKREKEVDGLAKQWGFKMELKALAREAYTIN